MKSIIILVTLLLVGCTNPKYEGIWRHQDDTEVAFFIFKNDYTCDFGFAIAGAMDGISSKCTYKIKDDIITVFFKSEATGQVDKMIIEYDETKKVMVEKEWIQSKQSNNFRYGFIFEKHNEL